jgi:hypothetical protein
MQKITGSNPVGPTLALLAFLQSAVIEIWEECPKPLSFFSLGLFSRELSGVNPFISLVIVMPHRWVSELPPGGPRHDGEANNPEQIGFARCIEDGIHLIHQSEYSEHEPQNGKRDWTDRSLLVRMILHE